MLSGARIILSIPKTLSYGFIEFDLLPDQFNRLTSLTIEFLFMRNPGKGLSNQVSAPNSEIIDISAKKAISENTAYLKIFSV
ncbi:MAG: hypothetical protein ACHQ6U_01580 [Thermodesulfobacteriota bacterium]